MNAQNFICKYSWATTIVCVPPCGINFANGGAAEQTTLPVNSIIRSVSLKEHICSVSLKLISYASPLAILVKQNDTIIMKRDALKNTSKPLLVITLKYLQSQ
jgi:hypothetical protein